MERQKQQRLVALDALRGIAIFGILMVNAPTLNSPVYMDGTDFAQKIGFLNNLYSDFLIHMAAGYFYPIFATLFGISAAIFLTKGDVPTQKKLFARRLAVLFLFGALQVFSIWWGDVLTIYALLGFFIIPLANCSERKLTWLMLGTFIAGLILSSYSLLLPENLPDYATEKITQIYQQGGFFAVTKQRLLDYLWCYVPFIFHGQNLDKSIPTLIFIFEVFTCFIAGFYLYRTGRLQKIIQSPKLAKNIFFILLPINVMIELLKYNDHSIAEMLKTIDGVTRAGLYASLIFFLCHARFWQPIIRPFALIGKMSLSCYLLSNLLLSLAFYGYGLGLYGTMGPFDQLPVILAIMGANLLFSGIWLRYFQFGPLEWLWRMLTYQKVIVLSKTSFSVAPNAPDQG